MKALAILVIVLGCLASAVQAETKVALVLGNGAYRSVSALANPTNDARALAEALRRLGFDVELGLDTDLAAMRLAVQSYARKLETADVALFFYAGHGMQVRGQNYLLPVDAVLQSEADLDFVAMPTRLIISQMERWPVVKIIILDACRDNPFARSLARSMGATRASGVVDQGLAKIEAAGGTLLAYATDPGDVAEDGAGDHSPFSAALLRHIETPGLEINTMLARVRADVFRATGQRQRPWTETSLIGEVYLAPAAPEPPPATLAMLAPRAEQPSDPPAAGELDPRAIEIALWQAAQAGGTAEDYQEYLRQYPDGIFAKLAQNRLASLSAPQEETPPISGSASTLPDAAQQGGSPPGTEPPPVDTAAAAEAGLGLDRDRRREIQARLLVAGHDPRGIDGVFGPATRAALKAWQRAEGFEPTGYIDADGLALLEQRTDAGYAAWVDRRRTEEAARRANAERHRRQAERAAAPRAAPKIEQPRAAPVIEATEFARPSPEPAAPAPVVTTARPLPAPPVQTTRPDDIRKRYEQDCYFVSVGKPQLERRCE